MKFFEQLNKKIRENNSLLCIGLDTDLDKIPAHLKSESDSIFLFNKAIIDTTHDLVCCYKANIAFYAAEGVKGLEALIKTVKYIHDQYTGIPFILDAKRADIGNTAQKYAKEAFEVIAADAVTVNPYMGLDSITPFLERKDRGVFILCRTSNQTAGDFQDLLIDSKPLYIRVAEKILQWNQTYGNCFLVVGTTWPEEIKKLRTIAPDTYFLALGAGSQGGNLQKTMKNGLINKSGLIQMKSGLIIHSARAIIYASGRDNFASRAREEARKLKEEINHYR